MDDGAERVRILRGVAWPSPAETLGDFVPAQVKRIVGELRWEDACEVRLEDGKSWLNSGCREIQRLTDATELLYVPVEAACIVRSFGFASLSPSKTR